MSLSANTAAAEPGKATAVAGGGSHSLAVMGAGTVWAWGDNYYGQLGDGTTTNRSIPLQVSGLSGVIAIAASDHSLALKGDGTVWAWGVNNAGQLGDGTITNRTNPVQVSGLSGVIAIAANWNHSLALKGDGTVWAWGWNGYGQLGDGTYTRRLTPVQLSGVSGVTAIGAGNHHSLAVKGDGTVWAWGLNSDGQLGNGTTTISATPVQASGLSGVTAIAGGGHHSLAVKGDGTVWAWGYNLYGQLGDGTTTRRSTPVQVSGLSGVTAVAAVENNHSLAVKGDGTVWAWGDNYFGQLGDGTTTKRTTPVQVSGAAAAVVAAAGGYGHSLAIRGDGTLWAWGANYFGQLGDGTTTNRSRPVQVIGPWMAAGCPQGEPTVSDDGPTGPEAEGGCVSDDVDGENVNNVEGGVPASSPATTAELVQAFGGSAADIPDEDVTTTTSSGASVSSGPSGFQNGGCPAGGTCTNVQLKWIKTLNIDKRDKAGVRLYFGYETRSWLVPAEVAGGNGKGRGSDGRTYDFLSPHVELTPVVGNAVLCSLKNTLVRTGGGSPAILSSYPSAAKTPVSPTTPNTITLSANVGGVGLSYSHQFSTAKGHIKGVYDPAKSSFTGTWVFGGNCSGRTTPDGVSLDSGIAYVYEPTDPAAVGRNYTWGRKVRKIDTNGAAVACFSPFCWPF